MGHQVNFYMLPDDLAEFEQMLQRQSGVVFLNAWFSTPAVERLPALAIPEMGKTQLMVYLAREADVPYIHTTAIRSQQHWIVDEGRSPVVEFTRCYYDGKMIRRGRLYFNTRFYDEAGHWVGKPHDFVRWADGLLRWIRKHYRKDPHTTFYVGSHAWQWTSQGSGQLNPL